MSKDKKSRAGRKYRLPLWCIILYGVTAVIWITMCIISITSHSPFNLIFALRVICAILFSGLFAMWLIRYVKERKEKLSEIPPLPPMSEIVKIMLNKDLDNRKDEIVNIIYSPDKTKRFLTMLDSKQRYYFVFESLSVYSEEEWSYICGNAKALPAMWMPATDRIIPFYNSFETAQKEMKWSPEYQEFFAADETDAK